MIWHSALAVIACALSLVANRINVMRLTTGYKAADSYFKVHHKLSRHDHGAATYRSYGHCSVGLTSYSLRSDATRHLP